MDRESKVCLECHKVFHREPGDRQWGRKKFCCPPHQQAHNNRIQNAKYEQRKARYQADKLAQEIRREIKRRSRANNYAGEKQAREEYYGARTRYLKPLLSRPWVALP